MGQWTQFLPQIIPDQAFQTLTKDLLTRIDAPNPQTPQVRDLKNTSLQLFEVQYREQKSIKVCFAPYDSKAKERRGNGQRNPRLLTNAMQSTGMDLSDLI